MSNTTLRLGLAGLSRGDARRLLPVLVGHDQRRSRLVAVADPQAGSAQAELGLLATTAGRRAALEAGHAVASDFAPGAVIVHEDAEAMVAEEDLDAVVVAASDRAAAIAAQALRRGLDVLLLAPEALTDAEALLYLSDLAERSGRVLWPAYPAGLIRPSGLLAALPELLGSTTGARATWNVARSSRPEPTDAARLLPLTTPLAVLADARAVEHTDVVVTGRGVERTVRVGWETGNGHRVEAEVRIGWTLGHHDRAWVTLYGTGGAQAELPIVAPDATTEPTSRALRGVLWHPTHGPITLPPPRAVAAASRAVVADWVEACLERRPHRAPMATAITAARFATDLAAAIRQDS